VVANTLQQELASACDSHLYQLDMRYETMQELQGLLLCQECLAAESTERNGQMNSSDNKFYCNTCLEMQSCTRMCAWDLCEGRPYVFLCVK
jgi:hypothetical protein